MVCIAKIYFTAHLQPGGRGGGGYLSTKQRSNGGDYRKDWKEGAKTNHYGISTKILKPQLHVLTLLYNICCFNNVRTCSRHVR